MAMHRMDWKPGDLTNSKAIELAIAISESGGDESLESYKERIDEMPCSLLFNMDFKELFLFA